MIDVNIHEAKTQLSALIARAEAGEDVIIKRNGEPVARLVAITRPIPRRHFGALAGRLVVGREFFEPLPDDELAGWER